MAVRLTVSKKDSAIHICNSIIHLKVLDDEILQEVWIGLQLIFKPFYLSVDLQHFCRIAVMSPAR